MVRVPEANQTAAEQGEAQLRILNFKATWSEVQKPKLLLPTAFQTLHVVLDLNKRTLTLPCSEAV